MSRAALSAVLGALALVLAAPVAQAAVADEEALAERYAPVVRIVEQAEECGPGEPYLPIDVELVFDEPTVALRGPWNRTDLIEIGPTGRDLDSLYEYHLDFPGDALEPGCSYERWGRRLTDGEEPAVYAHVATEPGHPGKLALQYWFFWVFNAFNNLHEGDWEMVQLVFDAEDARDALSSDPVAVGYSSHEGAERADWGDDKLELVDDTHPVVYAAAGSHANKFTDALYLGSSAEAGVGCDETRGPHVELRPRVLTIPTDSAAARSDYPWITFEGRWGELQRAFFNGPTGPNMKGQWSEPITWSEDWRERSYAVPTGGLLGTTATDFFCEVVAVVSKGLVSLLRDPGLTFLVLAVVLALAVFAATRTAWRPVAPLRVARRRSWGQILASAGRMYVSRARLFLAIGLVMIPLGALIAVVQAVIVGGFGLAGIEVTGESAGGLALLVVGVGTALALLGFALVQAATVRALVELDRGNEIGPIDAYRAALRNVGPLLRGLALAAAVWVALTTTAVLFPVAVWLGVRWLLLAQAVEVEGLSGLGGLRRSAELVRGRWLRIASLVGAGAALTLAAGPLLGGVLILLTDAPLPLLNLVAGVVYALAVPFVALATSYAYVDARVRNELEAAEPTELPAELELA